MAAVYKLFCTYSSVQTLSKYFDSFMFLKNHFFVVYWLFFKSLQIANWDFQLGYFVLRLLAFFLVEFIVIYISKSYSSRLCLIIMVFSIFLQLELFCAAARILHSSSWVDQSWNWEKNFGFRKSWGKWFTGEFARGRYPPRIPCKFTQYLIVIYIFFNSINSQSHIYCYELKI